MRIDLNADVGESLGAWSLGEDEALIPLVSSVNVAAGLHAGDPVVIERTVALAVGARRRGRGAPGLPGPRRVRAAGDGASPRRDRGVGAVPGRCRRGVRPRGGRRAAPRQGARRAVQPRGPRRGGGGGDRAGRPPVRRLARPRGPRRVGAGRGGTGRRPRGGRGGVRRPRLRGGRHAPVAGPAGRRPGRSCGRGRPGAGDRPRVGPRVRRHDRSPSARTRICVHGDLPGPRRAPGRCATRCSPRASRSVRPADVAGGGGRSADDPAVRRRCARCPGSSCSAMAVGGCRTRRPRRAARAARRTWASSDAGRSSPTRRCAWRRTSPPVVGVDVRMASPADRITLRSQLLVAVVRFAFVDGSAQEVEVFCSPREARSAGVRGDRP